MPATTRRAIEPPPRRPTALRRAWLRFPFPAYLPYREDCAPTRVGLVSTVLAASPRVLLLHSAFRLQIGRRGEVELADGGLPGVLPAVVRISRAPRAGGLHTGASERRRPDAELRHVRGRYWR